VSSTSRKSGGGSKESSDEVVGEDGGVVDLVSGLFGLGGRRGVVVVGIVVIRGGGSA